MTVLFSNLEQLLLLAILHLGENAYAVSIRKELESRCGRAISRGSIYVTLSRLERKGLVDSGFGDPLPERGGKARRYFAVTAAGVRSLRKSQAVLRGFWKEVEPRLETQ